MCAIFFLLKEVLKFSEKVGRTHTSIEMFVRFENCMKHPQLRWELISLLDFKLEACAVTRDETRALILHSWGGKVTSGDDDDDDDGGGGDDDADDDGW